MKRTADSQVWVCVYSSWLDLPPGCPQWLHQTGWGRCSPVHSAGQLGSSHRWERWREREKKKGTVKQLSRFLCQVPNGGSNQQHNALTVFICWCVGHSHMPTPFASLFCLSALIPHKIWSHWHITCTPFFFLFKWQLRSLTTVQATGVFLSLFLLLAQVAALIPHKSWSRWDTTCTGAKECAHLLSATVRLYSLVAPCSLPDLTSWALLGSVSGQCGLSKGPLPGYKTVSKWRLQL